MSKKGEGKGLPNFGAKISASKFHVSNLNVRSDQPFGEDEDDKILVQQIKSGRIVQPFKARPEGDGYGVLVGRRRFLAKMAIGVKEFIVGQDVLVEDVSDSEGRELSLVENLDILRKQMDPVTRAENLSAIVTTTGLRQTARKLGISASTLSEWLQVLNLSPKMQEALKKGLIFYTDALQIVRMEIPIEEQEKLADVLVKDGMDSFKSALAAATEGKMKRGLPKGKYTVLRTMFDKTDKADLRVLQGLEKLAKKNEMDIDTYSKKVLAEHVKANL